MLEVTAMPEHPIDDLLSKRWSPYAFDGRPVPDGDLGALFEAARWTPSSFNEQPWRYIVARRDDPEAFEKMLACLVEGNRAWARFAPVIALGVVSTRLARNDKPNRLAEHDLGAASANLTVEATKRGLSVHQMGGIVRDRARDVFDIPDGFEVVTALAIGYAGGAERLPEALRERDARPRRRRPITETVFGTTWEDPIF